MGDPPPAGRRWAVLALLCAAQFLVVLDITVVNVALPSIRRDLDVPPGHLHWAISAYAVAFGGALLMAGRLADLRGRRRVFLAGMAAFGLFSLACGLAPSVEALAAGRALQGLGAALISPAALAILADAFPDGRARTTALGVWGSAGALAASSGVLVGGALTEALDWRWVFLVNVPVAAVAIAAGPALLPRDGSPRRGAPDLAGAALVTGGLMLLVAAAAEAGTPGWSPPRTAGLAAAAAILIAAFARRERRSADPLVPAVALRSPVLLAASAAGFLHGAMMLGSFLLLTLYMQDVLGMGAVAAGAGLLAVRGTSVVWANVGARLANAVGAPAVMLAAMAGMTGALLLLARAPAAGSYGRDLLPGLLVLGAAIPMLFLAVNVTALQGVAARHSGLASGLLNTSQWIGGALGIAAVSALGAAGGAAGIRAGFVACAALGGAGCAVAAALLRRGPYAAGSGTARPRKAAARLRSGVPSPSVNAE